MNEQNQKTNAKTEETNLEDIKYSIKEVEGEDSVFEVNTFRNGKNYGLKIIALTEEEFERARWID